jgi:hypothetical protein
MLVDKKDIDDPEKRRAQHGAYTKYYLGVNLMEQYKKLMEMALKTPHEQIKND